MRDSGNAAGVDGGPRSTATRPASRPLSPTTATSSPGTSVARIEARRCGPACRRAACGSYEHDREVVQRVHVLDAARHLDRARERQPHVADRHRHGVAVDDDQAALGVDDEAGAVVVAVGDAGDRSTACRNSPARATARARLRRGRRSARTWCALAPGSTAAAAARRSTQGHIPGRVVALAAPHREPAPVHAHRRASGVPRGPSSVE